MSQIFESSFGSGADRANFRISATDVAVTVQTDSRGYAHADFTPLRAGTITVDAAARGASGTVTFTLTTGDAGMVKVSPASVVSPAVGEQLEMLINITGGRAVAAYQVSVEFDTTALRYVSSVNGDYLRAGVFFLKAVCSGSRC